MRFGIMRSDEIMVILKMRVPGVNPGVYNLGFVIEQVNYNDNHPSKISVFKRPVGRPQRTFKVSHTESCRKWRQSHPLYSSKSNRAWRGYNKGLIGISKLFDEEKLAVV